MPATAPALLARFHQIPMTSAGKNEAPARLKAQATSSTMSESRNVATHAAIERGHDEEHLGDGEALGERGVGSMTL